MENIEQPILDRRNNKLFLGDLVILRDTEDLYYCNTDFNVGDTLQYIGGDQDNIGHFIHCKTKNRVGFFADRVIKINKDNTMETYSKGLVDRRINLVMDEVECISKFLKDNYPDEGKLHEVMASLMNIEIALDFEDNESDRWTFYPYGSRGHLNNN
jgi:hypothetical protein